MTHSKNMWIVAMTVMLPTLMVIVDTSVVNVSLDHIRGSLSAGIDEATWSITSYLAANAIIIPMTGWLSRFFGRKRFLIFSVTLFTLSSLLCWRRSLLISMVQPWRSLAPVLCSVPSSDPFWEDGLQITGPGTGSSLSISQSGSFPL